MQESERLKISYLRISNTKSFKKIWREIIHNIFQFMISLSLSVHNCILHEIWRMEENHREREREISFFLCFILTNPWMTWQCFFVVSVVVLFAFVPFSLISLFSLLSLSSSTPRKRHPFRKSRPGVWRWHCLASSSLVDDWVSATHPSSPPSLHLVPSPLSLSFSLSLFPLFS